MNEAYKKACLIMSVAVKKEIDKLEKKLTVLELQNENTIVVKGIEITTDEELHELYGVGEITENQYSKYLAKLHGVKKAQEQEEIKAMLHTMNCEYTNLVMNTK